MNEIIEQVRRGATIVPGLVPKMRQVLTFLATIGTDHRSMKTLAVISILALLTIFGASEKGF